MTPYRELIREIARSIGYIEGVRVHPEDRFLLEMHSEKIREHCKQLDDNAKRLGNASRKQKLLTPADTGRRMG